MTQDPLFLVSANLFAAVLLRCFRPNVVSALVLTVVMIASTAYMGTQHGEAILLAIYEARDQVQSRMGNQIRWPPEKNSAYPDLNLRDQAGRLRKLSEFKGKVILLEPVGMSCPACIAFSGGQQRGPFRGVRPQLNLDSIEHYVREFGNITLDHPDLVFVQLLLFNENLEPPQPGDVASWAEHFGMYRSPHQVVLGGNSSLANAASQAIVPGFQLIDRNFVLRMDSTGERPADDLYRDLLPAIRRLLEE